MGAPAVACLAAPCDHRRPRPTRCPSTGRLWSSVVVRSAAQMAHLWAADSQCGAICPNHYTVHRKHLAGPPQKRRPRAASPTARLRSCRACQRLPSLVLRLPPKRCRPWSPGIGPRPSPRPTILSQLGCAPHCCRPRAPPRDSPALSFPCPPYTS